MTTDTHATPFGAPRGERRLAGLWGWPFVFGLLLMLLGLFALVAWRATSIASILVLGGLVLASGILEIAHAIRVRHAGHFWQYFLGGVLVAVIGGLLLWRPLVALATAALLLATYFLVSGLFHVLTAAVDRYPNWGWDLAYGLGALILGVITLKNWPRISLLLVGTLVGIEIFLRGALLMALSLGLRKQLRARPEAPAAPAPPAGPRPVAPVGA